MASPHPYSALRRWLRLIGLAVLQGALVGSTLGAFAYFRPPRSMAGPDEDSGSGSGWVRRQLERLELATYDWRARRLQESASVADDVVLVPVDEQTRVNARASARGGAAAVPWPRELWGGLVEQLVTEGAALVAVDETFEDASPRDCGSALPGEWPSGLGDDGRLRAELDRVADRSVLAFDWQEWRAPGAAAELTPFGVLVATAESIDEQWPLVQRILSERRRLFRVPFGRQVQLWAGAASREEAAELARQWQVRGTPEVRPLTALDLDHPMTAQDLLLLRAEV